MELEQAGFGAAVVRGVQASIDATKTARLKFAARPCARSSEARRSRARPQQDAQLRAPRGRDTAGAAPPAVSVRSRSHGVESFRANAPRPRNCKPENFFAMTRRSLSRRLSH